MDIRNELEQLRDEKYREFGLSLLPNVDKSKMIGVRLPQLRAVAARIKNRERVWEFLQPYFDSDKPYDIRFAVVSALDYFSDDEYAARAFGKFDAITNDDYYVKMAVAWAVSVFFVHAPEKTWQYLEDNCLDDFTFNKSLQKITESYRVTPQDKAKIRAMKRK